MTAMWGCPDGGTCHHECVRACFRVLACAPLSHTVGVGPHDYWPPDVLAAHRQADGVEPPDEIEVTSDYPMRAWLGLVAPEVDEEARKFALLHFQQGHTFQVFALREGGRVARIECECDRWIKIDDELVVERR